MQRRELPRARDPPRPRPGALATAVALVALTALLAGIPGPSSAAGVNPVVAPPVPSGAAVPLGHSAPVPSAAPRPSAGFTLGTDGADPLALGLNWTNAGAFGYTLDESTNGTGGPWHTIANLSGGTTAYMVTGLTPGGSYAFEVVAATILGSQTSNAVAATQPTLGYLTYALVTSTSVQFNWTNNASYGPAVVFVSYQLFERVNGGAASPAGTFTNVSTLTTTVSGLSPSASYSFYLTTTDCTAGCGGGTPSLVSSESNVVSFGTPLPLSVSLVASRSVVDANQSDVFTCTPSGGTSPFSFAWDLGNGTFVPGGSTLSHAYPSAGNVTVTCEVTDATASRASAATTVTVDPATALALTLNRTAADAGQPVSFACVASGGTPPIALGWTFGDGTAASGSLATHAYGAAGSFAATCTGADAAGTSAVRTQIVTVSPALAVDATASHAAAAPGTPIAFTATPRNGSGTYTNITWSFGDAFGAMGATPSHAFASTGNFTVVATVNDSNGMTARALTHVDVTPVRANLAAYATQVAEGARVNFSATAIGGGGAPYNFTWSFSDGVTLYGPSASRTFPTAGTVGLTLVVTDALGGRNSTTATAVAVAAPPPPPASPLPWIILALGIVAGAGAGLVGGGLRRRAAEQSLTAHLGRVPPSDPSRVVHGSKICRACGASNVPMRTTCSTCGRPLRR